VLATYLIGLRKGDVGQFFVPVQRSLARADILNEYIRHTSSGLWAVPPGVKGPEDFWGSALFA
jgi:deferrochelatase/peroxidase EfeB